MTPFVHKEYPRCLHGAGGATLIVDTDADRDARLAEGWSLQPVPDAPVADVAPEPEPDPPVAVKPGKRKKAA